MAKIVYRQMLPLMTYPNKSPPPGQRIGAGGEEVVMAKLIAALARGLAGAVKISNLYPQASKLDI